jgi:hypothetical protein
MFMFDVETMDVESNAVVLSAAIIKFELDDKKSFQDYVKSACFVKFNVSEQVKEYKRSIAKDSVNWWKRQCEIAREVSFIPSADDVSAKQGIEILKKFIDDNGGPDTLFWMRGSLDQMVIDSLCRSVNREVLAVFNKWRDVRTAVDLMASNPKDGYSKIKNFNTDTVLKHDPRQDCALDIMMLLHHE